MAALFLPRGIRNHNPGNLRLTKTRWLGQKPAQTDPAFVEFSEAIFGLRALMKTLMTYHAKYGLDTIETIINRYAPPHENATDHYIHTVCRALGVRRRDKLDLSNPTIMTLLCRAIIRQENGAPPAGYPAAWYPDELYAAAIRSF